jgi:hypothetical protein
MNTGYSPEVVNSVSLQLRVNDCRRSDAVANMTEKRLGVGHFPTQEMLLHMLHFDAQSGFEFSFHNIFFGVNPSFVVIGIHF